MHFLVVRRAPLHANSFETKLPQFRHTMQKTLADCVESRHITLTTEN